MRPTPAIALSFLASIACGCGGDSVTEIFVCYSVDPALSMPDGSLRVCATADPDGRVLFGCDGSEIGRLDAPLETQGFVRRRAEGIEVELSAEIPSMGTIAQRAHVPFQAGRIVDLSLQIDPRCASVPCPAGQTCAAGACYGEDVDPACLTDHGSPARPGCTDPRVIPGCRAASRDGG